MDPEYKAQQLLKRHLTRTQWRDYTEMCCAKITAPSGNKYLVSPHYLYRLKGEHAISYLCIMVEDELVNDLPWADLMLARVLFIQGAEKLLLRIAHCSVVTRTVEDLLEQLRTVYYPYIRGFKIRARQHSRG